MLPVETTEAVTSADSRALPPTGKDTFWTRLFRGVWRVRQRPDWSHFAGPDWLERIMELPATDDFHAKQGRSTGRIVFHDGKRQLAVYLKRHYRLPLWGGLGALFSANAGHSPAVQEWDHLEKARQAGLLVPATVACGEFVGPWGRLQSFLAIEELTGMLALHQAIPAAAEDLTPERFEEWKKGLIEELVRLTAELHRRRWFHNDLYLCHFFVQRSDCAQVPPHWHGRVSIIDLHRLSENRRTVPWKRAKDLGQLLYSSDLPGVTSCDRLSFWRQYVAGEKLGSISSRIVGWLIQIKAWIYRRNHRRRA